MKHIFWLEPGKVAGRCGPSMEPWWTDQFAEKGFVAVLSVNDGLLCHPQDVRASGMAYACVPLSENAPPREGDKAFSMQQLTKGLAFIEQHVAQGAVLIHCHSGKDRTGLMMAYYLMKTRQYSVDQAMGEVRLVRPIAFTADGWDQFCPDVLDSVSLTG